MRNGKKTLKILAISANEKTRKAMIRFYFCSLKQALIVKYEKTLVIEAESVKDAKEKMKKGFAPDIAIFSSETPEKERDKLKISIPFILL